MTSSPNAIVDRAMAQLEAIADRLQRGEISREEADAESKLVHASLDREMVADINASVSARRAVRKRKSITAMLVLAALVLLALYFRHTSAA